VTDDMSSYYFVCYSFSFSATSCRTYYILCSCCHAYGGWRLS